MARHKKNKKRSLSEELRAARAGKGKTANKGTPNVSPDVLLGQQGQGYGGSKPKPTPSPPNASPDAVLASPSLQPPKNHPGSTNATPSSSNVSDIPQRVYGKNTALAATRLTTARNALLTPDLPTLETDLTRIVKDRKERQQTLRRAPEQRPAKPPPSRTPSLDPALKQILASTPPKLPPIPETVPAANAVGDARRALTSKKPPPKKVGVAVPSIVPPRYRKAVAKHGQRLNAALKAAGSPLTGPEYLAKLIQFEAGWNPKATGPPIAVDPSGAYGLGQFIDSTAADFRERLGVETENPAKPNQMIKGASMHASGKYDYGALYAGYNPNYSDTDPIPSVPSGQNVSVKVRKKALQKAAEGGPVAKSAGPQKIPGPWAGSQKIVKTLIGPYAKTEDWKDKEDRGDPGGTLHDIGTKDAFAADLPADEGIVDRIAKTLGLDPKEINYGDNPGPISYKGYEIEFLPYTHGSGPHVHIGAKWVGDEIPPGTTLGGPVTTKAGTFLSAPGTLASKAADTMVENAKRRKQGKPLLNVTPILSALAARYKLPTGSVAASDEASEEEEPFGSQAAYVPKRRRR